MKTSLLYSISSTLWEGRKQYSPRKHFFFFLMNHVFIFLKLCIALFQLKNQPKYVCVCKYNNYAVIEIYTSNVCREELYVIQIS